MPSYRTSTLSTAGLTFLNSGKRVLDEIEDVLLGTGTNWTLEHSGFSSENYVMPRETAATNFPFDQQRKVFSRDFGGTTWYLEMYNDCLEFQIGATAYDVHVVFWRLGTGYVSGPSITNCGNYRMFVVGWCGSVFSNVTVPDLTVAPFSLTNQYANPETPSNNADTTVICLDLDDSVTLGLVSINFSMTNSVGLLACQIQNTGSDIKNLGYSSMKQEDIVEYNTAIQELIDTPEFNLSLDHKLIFHSGVDEPTSVEMVSLVAQLTSSDDEIMLLNNVTQANTNTRNDTGVTVFYNDNFYSLHHAYNSFFSTSYDLGAGVKYRSAIKALDHLTFKRTFHAEQPYIPVFDPSATYVYFDTPDFVGDFEDYDNILGSGMNKILFVVGRNSIFDSGNFSLSHLTGVNYSSKTLMLGPFS